MTAASSGLNILFVHIVVSLRAPVVQFYREVAALQRWPIMLRPVYCMLCYSGPGRLAGLERWLHYRGGLQCFVLCTVC